MHAVAIQPSIFKFYYRGSLRLKKLKHGEIIHFLVWCHLRLSIIAGVRRLVSIIGRDTANSLRRHCRWVLVDSLFCHQRSSKGKPFFKSLLFFLVLFSLWFENWAFQANSTCLSVAVENWLQLLTDVGCLKRVMIDLFPRNLLIQHILNVCW